LSYRDVFKVYTPDQIRAKQDELTVWELKQADAFERYKSASSTRHGVAAITWANCREIVQHLRGQLQAMKRREWK
jgi:hypothetical protein